MDVKLITPKTERKLVTSLRAAISDVNQGANPNDAIVKQALDNGLGPEMACRLVEAYNTSKTLNRLKSTTGEKRAESFDIADRDTVIRMLYATDGGEKESSVVRYNNPSQVNFNKDRRLNKAANVMEKAAGVKESSKRQASGFAIKANALKQARGVLTKVAKLEREAKALAREAKEKFSSDVYELSRLFTRSDRVTMAGLDDIEARLLYHHGPAVKKAFDIALSMLPEKQAAREKRAESVPTSYVYPLDDMIYKAAEQATKSAQEAAEAHVAYIKVEKSASLIRREFGTKVDKAAGRTKKADDYTDQMGATADDDDFYEPSKGGNSSDEDGKNKKTIDPLDQALNFKGFGPVKKPDKPDMVFPAAHEGQLRSIRAKLLLNDMLSNDPVISGYPTEDVITTYNSLAEMVPALATQPIAMRGLMASMLQRSGGLDPMEVRELLGTEESKRKLRVLGE